MMPGRSVRFDLIADPRKYQRGFGVAERTSSRFAGVLKAGVVAGAGAAVGALGGMAVAAIKLGDEFKGASNIIRVGTGATGKQLRGLEADFRAVFASVPGSAQDAAQAIADLNTRTGQTGRGLQALARNELNLSRITKTDLTENIAATTRVFRDWSIRTEDQAGTLDKLFRASQASGASVTVLAQQVVQFGSPLRQLGFNFDRTLAMMAEFERAGVNMETALPGLRMALARFAKAGKDPGVALQESIRQIQNTGSAALANKRAIEVFGQRAGPDLAAAIREGHFDLAALMNTIARGSDTIAKASLDTSTWRDKLELLKKKIEARLAPVLTGFVDKLSVLADQVGPRVLAGLDSMIAKFSSLAHVVADKLAPALDGMHEDWKAINADFAALKGSVGLATIAFRLLDGAIEEVRGGLHLLRLAADMATTFIMSVEAAGLSMANAFLFVVEHTLGLFDRGIRRSAHNAREHIGAMRDDINRKLDSITSRKDITVDVTGRVSWSKDAALLKQLTGNFSHKLPAFREGGPVTMGSGPTADDVLARVSRGEFILNAAAVREVGVRNLEAINSRRFARGGLVDPRPYGALRDAAGRGLELASRDALTGASSLRAAPVFSGAGVGGNASVNAVARWTAAVLGRAGEWTAWARRIMFESAGRWAAVNRTDINWRRGTPSVGGAQVIAPTFRAYAGPYRNVGPFLYGVSINPRANSYAGGNYAIHRYGSLLAVDPRRRPYGYDHGGLLPPGLSMSWNGTGKPEVVLPAGASIELGRNTIRELARALQEAPLQATVDMDPYTRRLYRQLAPGSGRT